MEVGENYYQRQFCNLMAIFLIFVLKKDINVRFLKVDKQNNKQYNFIGRILCNFFVPDYNIILHTFF